MAEAIFSDVFGRLTWDHQLGCWLGGIDWPPGRYTEVAIWHPDTDVMAGLRLAGEGLDWLKDHEEHTRCCVAGQMLEVYNHSWREEVEPITEAAFLSRLELVHIAFEEDGWLLLTYDVGEMFARNVVDASFGPDRSFRGAHLVG
jgi:hypothetical protein